MRNTAVSVATLLLLLTMPAWPAKLVEAPPPPPMPEGLADEYAPPPKPAAPESMGLGQVLYENGCTSCHESVIRVGTRRTLNSIAALREQVDRRAAEARLQWSIEEVEAVVRYLDSRYYRFNP